MMRHTFMLLLSAALIACGPVDGQRTDEGHASGATMHAAIGKRVEGDGQLTAYVRRIFQDSKGRYWFGSNGDGIYRYAPGSASAAGVLEVFTMKDGLAGMQVTGILEDRAGHIWIATDGGVSRYDGSAFTTYTTHDGLPVHGCWSIFEARDGTIWVGTAAGVCRSRSGAASAEGPFFEPFALPTGGVDGTVSRGYWISSIAQDRKGDLWFATRDTGAFRYDPSVPLGGPFQWITTNDGLRDNELAGILVDGKDNVWFGSMAGGLARYDPTATRRTGGRAMQHFAVPDIGDNEVWTVFEDRDGDIWFSSERFGVYRYDGNALRNYSTEQGLGVLAVQTIHQDREGRMWFGGGGGLYRLEGDSMVHVQRNGPWQ